MTEEVNVYEPTYWKLPTHWATVMMYGDYSGIEDEDEVDAINRFIALPEVRGTQCVEVWDDKRFLKYHDAKDLGVLACECSTFVFT